MVSSLSPTVVVPVADSSGASTAYTSPTLRCLRSAKRRFNVPQDLGTATASTKDRHETHHLIIFKIIHINITAAMITRSTVTRFIRAPPCCAVGCFIILAGVYESPARRLSKACKRCPLPRAGEAGFLSISAGKASILIFKQ